MPKSIDYSWDLPYTPAELFAQGASREFAEAQAKAVGHYNFELVTLEDGPEGGRAYAKYETEVDIPDWAKKTIPNRAKISEQRTWGPPEADGSRAYTVLIKIEQVPTEIRGVVGLHTQGSGTLNRIHLDVKASIPIFGAKLEEMVVAELKRSAEAERDFMLRWMKTVSK